MAQALTKILALSDVPPDRRGAEGARPHHKFIRGCHGEGQGLVEKDDDEDERGISAGKWQSSSDTGHICSIIASWSLFNCQGVPTGEIHCQLIAPGRGEQGFRAQRELLGRSSLGFNWATGKQLHSHIELTFILPVRKKQDSGLLIERRFDSDEPLLRLQCSLIECITEIDDRCAILDILSAILHEAFTHLPPISLLAD
jgi:hypothetical protein